MAMSLGALSCLCLFACFVLLPVVPVFSAVLMVEPSNNLYIAANSMEIRSYNCSVNVGYTVRWEVNLIQYPSPSQFTLVDSGIGVNIVDSNDHRVSTILFSNVTRGNITLQCVAIPSTLLMAEKGDEYMVVSFGEPDAVDNLRLVPSKGDLILNWERPGNVPSAVEILYTVMINNTDTSNISMSITTSNSFPLRSLEEQILNKNAPGVCVMFEFSVTGSNEAGLGRQNTTIDTIPISPDVTLISEQLTVERVDLQPFSVQISFPPVNPCSVNFPLHGYTIAVGDAVTHVVDADTVIPDQDGRVRLKLNSTVLSEVALDGSYSLTVTPCNAITCRTSTPVTLNTTDVQTTEVIYFRNRLFLNCSFADNSRARGCAVRLTLAETSDTEIYRFLLDDGALPCFETNFRLDAGAYDEVVVVVDIEEDEVLGSGNLTVVPMNVTTEGSYTEITGCPIVTGTPAGLSSTETAIVGGVLGPSLVIAVVIAVIIVVILIMKRKAIKSRFQSDGGTYPIVHKRRKSSQDTEESAHSEKQKGNNGRIESDSETEPLITKGCSFHRETGTIIIDTRNLEISVEPSKENGPSEENKSTPIDQSEIKQLKMK